MFITNVISRSTTDNFSHAPPGGGLPLSLNFHNHCLLCLQHVDPTVLKAIIDENPKGLDNFQPILQFLTGTVDPALDSGDNGREKSKYCPVTSNLPPLCTLCYDILAELYKFYGELMEIQRKIQNQTEAARRIAKGTTRRGGMREEFFNRLKIAGLQNKEYESMEYFIENFHGLVIKADRKAVLPQLLPLNINDTNRSLIKLPTSLEPYTVVFAEPSMPNNHIAFSPEEPAAFDNMETITITSTSSLQQTPHQLFSNAAILVRIPTPTAVESINDYSSSNINDPILVDDDEEVQVLNQHEEAVTEDNVAEIETADEIYVVRGDHDPLSFEYEGDEDEEELAGADLEQQGQREDLVRDGVDDDDEEEERIARELMLEKGAEMILEQLEMGEEKNGEGQVQMTRGEDDPHDDVNYWKSALSSQVIMEAVETENMERDEEGEDDCEIEEVPVKKKVVEVIDLDDDDDDDFEFEMEAQNLESAGESFNTSIQQPSIRSVQRLSTPRSRNNGVDPPFRCSTCGKGYNSNQRLRYHEQLHLAGGRPKPWICQHCHKGFAVKKLLEQHERIHTGERPFTCDVCGDSFRQSSTLYRHKTVHSKPKQIRRLRKR